MGLELRANDNGKGVYEFVIPTKMPDDLVFSIYHHHKSQQPNPITMYFDFAVQFERTLDRIGFGEREIIADEGKSLFTH